MCSNFEHNYQIFVLKNMAYNTNFYIKNLQYVVFIGNPPDFEKLKILNNELNIKTIWISDINNNQADANFKTINSKFIKFIRKNCKIKNSLFFSYSSKIIFKENEIKKIFQNNIVNYHPSRLPFDKGGGGYSWRILKNDRIQNQCIHLVTKNLDSGKIIYEETSLFPSYCRTPKNFLDYGHDSFFKFYEKFINLLKKNKKFTLNKIPTNIGNYYPRLISKKDGFINWDLDPLELSNFINAFDEPFIGATTFVNKKKKLKVYLKQTQLHGGEESNHPYMSGLVLRNDNNWLVVATKGKYCLIVEKVLDVNGNNILKKIKIGDRLFTPSNFLDNSKKKRSFI